MIFLSAQPDTPYFIWQVELQLFNLQSKGWAIKKVHILFAYDLGIGENHDIEKLKRSHPEHNIFSYSDTRENKIYPSTIRPHIITKHLDRFPHLFKESIFYIDSDVIFRELPDFNLLLKDDKWYASDTNSYMNYKLIIDALGYQVFSEMCHVIGITPEQVIQHEINTGGAQYIIKDIPIGFWTKVEQDSLNLYEYLYKLLYENTDHNFFEKKSIDIWLTEMWVVCWNAILINKPFIVHPDLNFSWANQKIEYWKNTHMLHYTGSPQKHTFHKTNYILFSPFYANLSHISDNTCSAPLRGEINKYVNHLKSYRIDLINVTFIIDARSHYAYSNIETNIAYISKYIDTHIIILCDKHNIRKARKILEKFPEVQFLSFIKDEKTKQSTIEAVLPNIQGDIFGIIKSHQIIPISKIIEIIDLINKCQSSFAIKSNNKYFKMDVLTEFVFKKTLDYTFLEENKNKMYTDRYNDRYEGLFFASKVVIQNRLCFRENIPREKLKLDLIYRDIPIYHLYNKSTSPK